MTESDLLSKIDARARAAGEFLIILVGLGLANVISELSHHHTPDSNFSRS
jgi:hypothetical protein